MQIPSGAALQRHSPTVVPFLSRKSCPRKIRTEKVQIQHKTQHQTRPRQSGNRSVAASADVAEALEVQEETPAPTLQLRLEIGAKVIPHPEKASYGGEDAFFLSNSGGGAMGVADGVGGWQESGINPAEYSRTFMRIACHYLEGKDIHPVTPGEVSAGAAPLDASASDASSTTGEDSEEVRTVGSDQVADILTARGALAAAHAGTRLPGSSTACVLRLNRPHRTIEAANLGDSGFMLVRDGEVVFKAPVLQHFFDCPLQFGACPDYSESTDTAEDAAVFELAVQPGDVLLAGSDGLWDNCYDSELLQLLPDRPEAVDQAAGAIAALARQHATDKTFSSPYTEEAKRQGYDLPWWEKITTASFEDGQFQLGTLRGGKIDDITVLVAVVVEEEIVVGFSQERGLASFSCSPPTRLPESPLAKLLKAQKQLPRLKLVTKVARAEQSLCTNSNGLQMPRTIAGTSREDECASGRTSHTSSLSRSSDPICIPEMCARSQRSLPVQGQILEDLSLDADALCMLRFSPQSGLAPTSRMSSGEDAESGPSSLPRQADATMASAELETLAVSQLRGLECHAMQGDDELHMVSLVHSMRLAAEEHDRMLLECALLKARTMSNLPGGGSQISGNVEEGWLSWLWQGMSQPEGQDAEGGLYPALAKSFFMILVTELGDETFIIAAIMAMRHPRLTVFAGAMSALGVMTVISTALGYVLPNLISRKATQHAASVLYTFFGLRLLYIAWHSKPQETNQEEVEEVEQKVAEAEHSRSYARQFFTNFCTPVFLEAFVLTFLAEWGDRSQIATVSLAAVYNPVGVTIGAVVGHMICTGTAVVGGQLLAMRISQRTVAVAGGLLFLAFALHSVVTNNA
ncbi:hypothetical protein WJX75_008970 [Coccomyxa subellipsoidea]|uniref:PPM-type phosphatase domain-containing protein n=1 Tax=Coccomyxa subellipsoidea TaxID=248742 RepID=A0ABR2Z108_9CHLO